MDKEKFGWLVSGHGARIATGLVLAASVLALFLAASQNIMVIVIALVSLLAMREYNAMVFKSFLDFPSIISMLCAALVVLAALLGPLAVVAGLCLCFVLMFLACLIKGGELEHVLDQLTKRCWSLIYIAGHLACVVLLANQENGRILVIFLLACVCSSDVGAYYSGRFAGKHKMAPVLSPGKTIEGLAGGLVLAACIGGLFSVLFFEGKTFFLGALVGLVLGAISVAGDLLESIIKRSAGVKDSGNILPGHGGILDRLDGILLAAPALLLARVLLW